MRAVGEQPRGPFLGRAKRWLYAVPGLRAPVADRRAADAGEAYTLTLELLAHDLRAPLASSRMIVDQLRPDAPAFLLDMLSGSLDQIETLLQPLTVGAAQHDGCPVPVHLEVLLRESVASSSRPDAVDCELAGGVVIGDADLLKASLRNLVENALRYAEETVVVTSRPQGMGYLVTVDDDGPGVPADLRETVFYPFVRLDPERDHGLGLGLSLVRRVADLHGGNVWIGVAPSGGARFGLWLPAPSRPDDIPGVRRNRRHRRLVALRSG